MAVTIAMVTENVWKTEKVGYKIRVKTPTRFTLLLPLNLRNPLICLVYPDQFNTVFRL
jgi:hypothetical protein